MAPRGDSILGLSRTTRDDRLASFEIVVIRKRDGTLVYEADPSGQSPATFVANTIGDATIVFENLEHDFPQRIGYQRSGPDSLSAWIEGTRDGEARRIDFPYRRVPCPDASRPEGASGESGATER
jgi:hypothetical protein